MLVYWSNLILILKQCLTFECLLKCSWKQPCLIILWHHQNHVFIHSKIVSTLQIYFRKHTRTMQFIKHIFQSKDRICILYSDFIYGSIVYTHASRPIFLWNQDHRNKTWETFPYKSLLQKIVNLPLNLLCFFWTWLICWPAWKWSTRNEVNLILNNS